jgi:hypothetical protein
MTEFAPDELFLRGRVQIETALGALAHTGANPDAQQQLQTFLDVHGQLSDGETQNDLVIYLKGEATEREKTDILNSLDVLRDDESATTGARVAAAALRSLLTSI